MSSNSQSQGTQLPSTPFDLKREQRWRADTREVLNGFLQRTDELEKAFEKAKGKKAFRAFKALSQVRRDLDGFNEGPDFRDESALKKVDHLRLIIQKALMGQKPEELTWSQWRTWNLAPFFTGPKKWLALRVFLEIAAGRSSTDAALRKEFERVKKRYGSLPIDCELAVHWDILRGHRRRSRLEVIKERVAWHRLQLVLNRSKHSETSPAR